MEEALHESRLPCRNLMEPEVQTTGCQARVGRIDLQGPIRARGRLGNLPDVFRFHSDRESIPCRGLDILSQSGARRQCSGPADQGPGPTVLGRSC